MVKPTFLKHHYKWLQLYILMYTCIYKWLFTKSSSLSKIFVSYTWSLNCTQQWSPQVWCIRLHPVWRSVSAAEVPAWSPDPLQCFPAVPKWKQLFNYVVSTTIAIWHVCTNRVDDVNDTTQVKFEKTFFTTAVLHLPL
jgi:hypothetical protein